jgi:hypothetical protein
VIRALTAATAAAALAAQQQPAPPARAFVELAALPPVPYVQQPVRLQLRIGVERAFLQQQVIPTFRQPLDLPVQVRAGWLAGLPGMLWLDAAPGARSFALGDRVATATAEPDRDVGGRAFAVVRYEQALLPQQPGELVFRAPLLELTYATQFDEDLFAGRVPRDRRQLSVLGDELRLQVQPLPVEGRPPEFTGAVGSFSIAAEATPRELAVGARLTLVLAIEGDGNLAFFAPPEPALPGFHVHGRLEERRGRQRRFVYDLAPLAPVPEVPAIRWAYFDPAPPPQYRPVATEPIRLRVSGTAIGTGAAGANDELRDWKPAAAAGAGWPGLLEHALALLLPWLAAGALLQWRRRAAIRRRVAEAAAARAEASALRAQLAGEPEPAAAALAAYLAARLRTTPAAIVAPELRARLAAAGLPPDLAARTAALLDALTAARYGGRSAMPADAPALAGELAAAFAAKGR